MPVRPKITPAQHSTEPTEPPNGERETRPIQQKAVEKKKKVPIHKIADWLDSRYLSRNLWLAESRSPAYSEIENSASTNSSGISQRTDFQFQPSAAKVGAAARRMPFS